MRRQLAAAAILAATLTVTVAEPADAHGRRNACHPTIPWSKLNGTQQRSANTIRVVWPDHLEARALQVAYRESRLIPTARNKRSSATGTFQILASLHGKRARALGMWPLTDGTNNTRFALDLYQRAGWRPWACR